MIRRATALDMSAVEQLIRRQHAASKYAERTGINDKALSQMLLGMHAQQGQRGPQGSIVNVAVRDGKVVGFIAGILDRVYQIGDKLSAVDLFFVNEGTVGDTLALLDSYVAWARDNRRVIEVMVSWTDTLPGAEKVAKLYERKGFVKSGESYEMRVDVEEKSEAA